MPQLTLASPVFLLALPPVLAVLLWIHLRAARRRPIVFPSVELIDAVQRSAPRRLPRRWWLLLLRALALSLIVLAFAQPTAHTQTPAGPLPANAHHVLVIDRSASMNRTERGHSLLQRAINHATDQLQQLDPQQARTSVVLLDAQPRPLLPRPASPDALMQQIDDIEPTWHHARAADAIELIAQLHRQLDAPRPPLHVHWISDAQQTQWPDAPAALFDELNAALHPHTLGTPEANHALHQASADPSRPLPGEPVQISAQATNHSDQSAEVEIELQIDGHPVATQRVTPEPRETVPVHFEHTFTSPGMRGVELHMNDPGALTADASTGQLIHVREHRRIALLGSPTRDQSTTYLRAALHHGPIDLHAIAPDQLASTRPDVLIVADTEKAEPQVFARAIAEQLQADRPVLLFMDDPHALVLYEHVFTMLDTPSGLRPRAEQPWTDQPRDIALVRFDKQPLSVFQDAARTALMRATLPAGMRARAAPETTRLIDLDDNTPLLALQPIGRTHLATFTSPLAQGQDPFALHPAFLPLLHELLTHLDRQPTRADPVHPGQPLAAPAQAAGGNWHDPAGQPLDTSTAQTPGLHTFHHQNSRIAGQWVDLDPRQSDLRRIDLQPIAHAGAATSGAGVQREIVLWPALIVTALLVLMLEPLVASLPASVWPRVKRSTPADGAADAA